MKSECRTFMYVNHKADSTSASLRKYIPGREEAYRAIVKGNNDIYIDFVRVSLCICVHGCVTVFVCECDKDNQGEKDRDRDRKTQKKIYGIERD